MNIKWNEYTWYSKLAAIVFFMLVLPAWTFYIGMKYQEAKEGLSMGETVENVSYQKPVVKKVTTTDGAENLGWQGIFKFSEVAPQGPGSTQFWGYTLKLSSNGGKWRGTLDVDGFQASERLNITANNVNYSLDVIFDSYAPGNMQTFYKKGDVLFTLTPSADGQLIEWKKLQPNVEASKEASVFTRTGEF